MSSCKYKSTDGKAFCKYINGECQFLSEESKQCPYLNEKPAPDPTKKNNS